MNEELCCPISKQLFRHPVVCSDTYTYEHCIITEYLKMKGNISPLTRVECHILGMNRIVKNLVDIFLEKNPHLAEERFKEYDAEKPKKNIIWNTQIKHKSIQEVLQMIEETDDLEKFYENSWRPIHFACALCTPEVFLAMIEKGVNLEVADNQGNYPIHIAIRYSNSEVILAMIEKGVNLEVANNEGNYPIHIAASLYSNSDVILAMIEKGVNLEVANNQGNYPIHLACKYSPHEIILIMMIEKNVRLNVKNNCGQRPIDVARKYSTDHVISTMKQRMKMK